jgi:hypothetical protein
MVIKENQPAVYQAIAWLFAEPPEGVTTAEAVVRTVDKGHGRAVGDGYIIVNKTSVGPVSGTFQGLAEGSFVTLGGRASACATRVGTAMT